MYLQASLLFNIYFGLHGESLQYQVTQFFPGNTDVAGLFKSSRLGIEGGFKSSQVCSGLHGGFCQLHLLLQLNLQPSTPEEESCFKPIQH